MIYLIDFASFLIGSLFSLWWLLLPVMLWLIIIEKQLFTARYRYGSNLKWVFVEIQVPPEVTRTPKAMEEVFNSLHSIYRGGTWYTQLFNGFVAPSFTLELIAHAGSLKFFIRCQDIYRDLVKSQIYSQYPEAKVQDAEDPLKDLPEKIPNPTYDIFGSDFRLPKVSGYPIRTYEAWERLPEEEQIDPISILSEGAAQFSDQEWGVIQIPCMPVLANHLVWGESWHKAAQAEVDKLIGRTKEKEPGPFDEIAEFATNLVYAPFRDPVWKGADEKKEKQWPTQMQHLTPGQKLMVESIERKMGKQGYWCSARIAYIGRKDLFNRARGWSVLLGFFRLFSTQDLNGLIPDIKQSITTMDEPSYSIKERVFYRKRILHFSLRLRIPGGKDNRFILVGEELASLFHLPRTFVPAPGIERRIFAEKPPPTEIPMPEV